MSKSIDIILKIRELNFQYRQIESNLERYARLTMTPFDVNQIPQLVKLDKQIRVLFRELEMLKDFE
mgnify:CR=1 FL=1